uniref:Septin-7 n=1 Tax=Gasterosteus aculeatus aculeatus TaxID=481459 RepID=A0AAQ4S8S3_GASAC
MKSYDHTEDVWEAVGWQADASPKEAEILSSSNGKLQQQWGGAVLYGQQKNLEGYVGFASLPNQVYRKSVKRGFEFTLMVVGESGLGKSTLINSLFLTDLYSGEYPGPSHRIKKTVQVEQSKVLIKEGGVQLLLTIVDTPGFGDAVDNSNCWQPIIDHIDSKFEDYLNSESRVNRRQMPDSRIHCCLYFIAPSGHGLKPLDIEFMKRLHEKVNVIPLIAKADTLTPEECQQFKKQIMREIQEHKIKIYEFPETDDEEENRLDKLPLAVVGSNTIIEVNSKRVRGRQYPWGVAEVENGDHCDFTILRDMLIRTHMQDLKDVTNNVHYENYRSRKLAAVTYNGVDNNRAKGQLSSLTEVSFFVQVGGFHSSPAALALSFDNHLLILLSSQPLAALLCIKSCH